MSSSKRFEGLDGGEFANSKRGLDLAHDVIDHQIDRWASLPRQRQEAIRRHIAYFAGRIARLENGLDPRPGKDLA
jgi:hypothetical protein